MDQRLYFVVEIDGRGFVFENIRYAASFMYDAAAHVKQGRYNCRNTFITMYAADYDRLCQDFPDEYKKEDAADETTTCTDADQTEV